MTSGAMAGGLFAKLLDVVPDAAVVVGGDGYIVMVNVLAERMFGYRRGDMTGMKLEALMPPARRQRHRKLRSKFFDKPMKRPMSGTLVLDALARDGSIFPVEISLGPIAADGELVALAIIRDVTEKHRAEAETLAAKDSAAAADVKLRGAIESITEGFVLYDAAGRLVLCNGAFRKFYSYSKADTKPGIATYESLGRLDQAHDRAARKRLTFAKRLAIFSKDGVIHDNDTVGDRIIERRQELTAEGGIISVQTDVTDRVRAEAALLRQRKFSSLLQRITVAANQAASVDSVLRRCLKEVCAATGWPVGHVYLVADDGSGEVMSSGLWRSSNGDRAQRVERAFKKSRFKPGKGLIGQVLASGKPVWIADVTEDAAFERVKRWRRLGFRAGFAFPVLTGHKVAAVIEFFTREAVEPDRKLLDVMAQIGTQLGRVMERSAAEDALRRQIRTAGLIQKITIAANQAQTVEDGLRICLDEVCAYTGWPVGHVFMPVPGDRAGFVSSGLWHLDRPRKFAAFKRVSEGRRFRHGNGLIGRVVDSGRPVWVLDVGEDAGFERAKLDAEIGVRTGLAFPVLAGDHVTAVLEFFTPERVKPDAGILDVMAQIGTQLGRVMERRMAQDALMASEERFRFVMDNSPAAVNLKDMEGRYLLVNARFEEWYGLAAENVIGKTVTEVFPALKIAQFASLEREVLSLRTAGEREFEIDFADGRTHLVLGAKFIVEDSAGKPMGIGTIETDITEPRHTETQLRQAQKMEAVGQLTGGVAHDFNNLLAVISGNLELLNEALEGDEKKQELLSWAITAADDAATLTQRLLAFSRQQPLLPRTVLISALVGNLLGLLRHPFGEAMDIETSHSDALWLTTIDPAQFENAVLNLVLNARDAMPGGGAVTITTANVRLKRGQVRDFVDVAPGDYVTLSVADTGQGMSEEALDHAFEPFYTTKGVGEGSGLGLSMVYGFSKQSGGHAVIESIRGHGATVTLYLPRAEGGAVAVAETGKADMPPGRGEVVLVVEDEEGVRDLAVRLLGDLGYEVLEAADAFAALDIIAGDVHLDLLFTDIVLPGGVSGRELAARACAARPSLAVMYVSGYSTEIEAESPLEVGAVRLAKPYRKSALAKSLREALGDSEP